MMRKLFVVLMVGLCFGGAAEADVFGLGPTLAGKGPALCAEQIGAEGPLPSNIIGLEGYSLFGKNAGAAAAVCYKRTFLDVPVGNRKVQCRYGLLAGLTVAADNGRGLIGAFAEAEAEGIGGVVIIVRADDGIYVTPGFVLNVVSVSF